MKTLIAIPSRIGSTRLANKAILDINGLSMIRRVVRQAKIASAKLNADLIVATDSDLIKNEVDKEDVRSIYADNVKKTGTDAIFNAITKFTKSIEDYDCIINVQGDVPNIDPDIIIKTANVLKLVPQADIATTCCVCDPSQVSTPSVVKACLSFDNNFVNKINLNAKDDEFAKIAHAVYFSRNPIPHKSINFYEHIGIYAYRPKALKMFVDLDQGTIEKLESLEQLRAIENGMKIFSCLTKSKPISVDTQSDIEYAREMIF